MPHGGWTRKRLIRRVVRSHEVERGSALEDGSSGSGTWRRSLLVATAWVCLALVLSGVGQGTEGDSSPFIPASLAWPDWEGASGLPAMGALALVLLCLSAFFSACEIAYFSLSPARIRALREDEGVLNQLVGRLMLRPHELLTSVLMGNSIAKVLLSIVLVQPALQATGKFLPHPFHYVAAAAVCTIFLAFFGDVVPKLAIVRNSEGFARSAALPLHLACVLLVPLRVAVVWLVGLLFRVTGFSRVQPAPFMTDADFASILSEGEATGAIEKEEAEMIQGILNVNDVMLWEILVPRPDIVALNEEATVAEALELICTHEFSRMPTYRENLDNIVGILYAKDLLSLVDRGELSAPIKPMLRKANYVPETMTVLEFMKSVQHLRSHLAIVVDEYGGTEGLVTLQDALREVVGELEDDWRDEPPLYTELRQNVYQVDGSLPLDELEALTGVPVNDDEHTTVAGFLMEQSDKVLEVGDRIEHEGVRYTVEEVDGKRVARLKIQILQSPAAQEEARG